MNISIDDWFALSNKIDMIPNSQTACIMRDKYMSIEAMRLRGMNDCSDEQRYLKKAVDLILLSNKDNASKGDKQ